MNTKHLILAEKFNSFAYELVSNEEKVKSDISLLTDDVLYRRIIFNKYYYALYHKYLAYDVNLSINSGSNKHSTILKKLQNYDDKLYLTFSKLQSLRIWADYQLEDNPQAININLITLNEDVWNFIKRKTISC